MVSTFKDSIDGLTDVSQDNRINNFRLRDIAGSIMNDQRVCKCGKVPTASKVKVNRHINSSKAHYSGLQTCGSVWVCPVCASKTSEKRRLELSNGTGQWIEMGGKLLIGVADSGEILGLQDDYNSLREANKDYFEIHLNNLINSAFGKDFAPGAIQIHFPTINEEEICEISIEAGNAPLYIDVTSKNGLKQRGFFVRSGNSSQDLDIDEAASYIQNRFTKN